MSELPDLTLVAAAEGIRRGEFSARELTEASLARIEEQQPHLNCFTEVWDDAASSWNEWG